MCSSYVCVTMYSLVMTLFSHDFIKMYTNRLIKVSTVFFNLVNY